MASSYSSSVSLALNTTETFDATVMPFVNSGANAVVHTGIDLTQTLNATSSPAISKMAAGQKAMIAGVATIDLTAVTHNGAAVDMTGLKMAVWKFRNPSTNANNITITKGAANGYTIGGGTFTVTLKPGQQWAHYFFTGGDSVAAGVKTIDISGTGTQALDYEFIAG